MELVAIKDLKISGDRQRSEVKDLDRLADSISEFGILEPIIIDENNVLIAGFRRMSAAILLDWAEVPAIRRDDLSELDKKRIELEENIQRQQLTWAEEAKAIAEIDAMRAEIDPNWNRDQTAEVVGKSRRTIFNSIELAKALEDDPELAEAKTLVGALQRLGQKKRLAAREAQVKSRKLSGATLTAQIEVGDALDLIRRLPDESIDTIVTNPPFGINLTYEGHPELYEDDPEIVVELVEAMVPEMYRVLKPNTWCIVFWDILKLGQLAEWMEDAGFDVNKLPCIWGKPNKTQGTVRDPWGLFIMSYEGFLMAKKGDAVLKEAGRQNLFLYDTPEEEDRVHPVQMSTELCVDLVNLTTLGGELVLDPFAGSGAVGLGALHSQGNFIGFELNPEYARYGNMRLKEGLYEIFGSDNDDAGDDYSDPAMEID